ncbi:hypothetical protein NKZ04_21935 [Sinorhizobium meliloti]|uniref:hypothetical protein n=1 Tax=Rhizobium meliloti TaxID=382 RepID=UPI003D661292
MTLGSIAARNGAISFDGLQQRRYKPMQTCNRSKLACIMFAFELSRRSKVLKAWGHIPASHAPI